MGEMDRLRELPRVDAIASSPGLAAFPVHVRTRAARHAISLARAALLAGEECPNIELAAQDLAKGWSASRLPLAINASGVILHTGLGRARLAPAAEVAVALASQGHAAVELDLASGARGDRQTLVRELLCQLTGAEDALVVNNCAAAVFLSLAALAEGREIILSRGQMVEIGGSFRMPDIVVQSGCKLVEVGCTNKVRLSDYEGAITDRTAAILRCHPSNFRITGFTEEPSVTELAELAHRNGLRLIDDAGSGALVDTSKFGLPREPLLGESLKAGADVAMASGDKLLGGPQAGLIVGSHEAVSMIARHPLARAVRVDKLTLAALAATLQMYANGQADEIPTLCYLGKSLDEVKRDAEQMAVAFPGAVVEQGLTEVGGGSIPGEGIQTWRCGLDSDSCDDLARALRMGSPPVISRIEKGRVWLDPRTMEPDEVATVCDILKRLS